MGQKYRSWAERRNIIRSIIADSNPPELSSFGLSDNEEQFFRSRSEKVVSNLAKKTSSFKAYYALPVARPFRYVAWASFLVAFSAFCAAGYLIYSESNLEKITPVLAGCGTVAVIALGWAIVGSMTHRYNIRQKTLDLLFARFSQQNFSEALRSFHDMFGQANAAPLVTTKRLKQLRASDDEKDRIAATSTVYLLNYFEFIASGVIGGDLDGEIIRDNIKGLIEHYHDKCGPYITDSYKQNGRTFANLIRLRTHYREP